MKAGGFRLIDGVILAAVALLGLKTLGLVSGRPAEAPSAPAPTFGRVLSHARTNYDPQDPTTTGSVPDAHGAPDGHGAPPPAAAPEAPAPVAAPAPEVSKSERALLERLGERREQLQQRDREMETREKLLEENERRLDQRLGEMKALEEKQGAAAAKRADTEAAGLKSLVTMYETMKPKEAARVFERLPQDVLVPVVVAMNPRKMSEVLAAMSPDNAQKLTVALAKRAAGRSDDKASAAPASLPAGELPAIELPRR